jgi:hypothetical protein
MCGTPVLVIKRNQVVGIISEYYKPIDYKDEATDLALPVKSMTNLYYILQGKNAGLTVLSRFLQATSEEVESSFYKGIDEVYAPTVEYKVIKGSLKQKKCNYDWYQRTWQNLYYYKVDVWLL